MKCCLIVLLLASAMLNAQVTVVSPRLTDSTAAVVYAGVDNPIEIKGMDKPEYYYVSISGGRSSITLISSGRYIIRASGPDSLTLTIIRLRKVMIRKKFAVHRLPAGELRLADSTETRVSKEAILANPKLEFVFPGCLYKHGIAVYSFSMTIDRGEEIIEVPAVGDTLSARQIELIKEAAPDATMVIDNIYATGPDGKPRKLPGLIRYLR